MICPKNLISSLNFFNWNIDFQKFHGQGNRDRNILQTAWRCHKYCPSFTQPHFPCPQFQNQLTGSSEKEPGLFLTDMFMMMDAVMIRAVQTFEIPPWCDLDSPPPISCVTPTVAVWPAGCGEQTNRVWRGCGGHGWQREMWAWMSARSPCSWWSGWQVQSTLGQEAGGGPHKTDFSVTWRKVI